MYFFLRNVPKMCEFTVNSVPPRTNSFGVIVRMKYSNQRERMKLDIEERNVYYPLKVLKTTLSSKLVYNMYSYFENWKRNQYAGVFFLFLFFFFQLAKNECTAKKKLSVNNDRRAFNSVSFINTRSKNIAYVENCRYCILCTSNISRFVISENSTSTSWT